VALSGIAIAIGTIVDMGIVLSENILRRLDEAEPRRAAASSDLSRNAPRSAAPCSPRSLTTVVSFLPVFTMEAAEGKLFGRSPTPRPSR
jgi:copper/silver efflux system protein